MKSVADHNGGKKPTGKENDEKPASSSDEIDSDGSASAFSGSELLPESQEVEKNTRDATDPDPSGNSDY